MKIEKIGGLQTVMSNPDSKHNYFGWPTIARLKNGRIAVAASGFRLKHVCPFGKTVISISEDECKTFSRPMPIIDTPLDDRDGGLMAFGESGVMITAFNNTAEFQRKQVGGASLEVAALDATDSQKNKVAVANYIRTYCDMISEEDEKKYLGANFRMSFDNGVTWGPIHFAPVNAPHGPIELRDGTIFYLGRQAIRGPENPDGIYAYKINYDGSWEKIGRIPDIDLTGLQGNPYPCEPHAIELKDGRILAHIRVNTYAAGCPQIFTLYQSITEDGGKTWTQPKPIIDMFGGAPAHLCRLSNGDIISVYSQRIGDFDIKAMRSKDEGETWDIDNVIVSNKVDPDFGYPSTVELNDGTLFTIFYGHEEKGAPATIMGQRWKIIE